MSIPHFPDEDLLEIQDPDSMKYHKLTTSKGQLVLLMCVKDRRMYEVRHIAPPETDPNYILNPRTGKYVKRDGKIGRDIIIAQYNKFMDEQFAKGGLRAATSGCY